MTMTTSLDFNFHEMEALIDALAFYRNDKDAHRMGHTFEELTELRARIRRMAVQVLLDCARDAMTAANVLLRGAHYRRSGRN
jgi:hypothetical protein